MTTRTVVTPFIISLFVGPLLFVVARVWGGPDEGAQVTQILFLATVLVEIAALIQAAKARKLFSPSDGGHLTWTLIVAFLIVRLAAELRLTSINLGIVPRYNEGGPDGLFLYVVVLRYLYTVSDLLFIGALAATIRSYKSTGLKFGMVPADYVYIALVWTMPVTTYLLRDNLGLSATGDAYITSFRIATSVLGAFIVSMCIVVRRYVVQMGGGAVGRVWNMVVTAGAARTASFLALAIFLKWVPVVGQFIEQYLLWAFACCWLIAALYQQEVLPRVEARRAVADAPPEELRA